MKLSVSHKNKKEVIEIGEDESFDVRIFVIGKMLICRSYKGCYFQSLEYHLRTKKLLALKIQRFCIQVSH